MGKIAKIPPLRNINNMITRKKLFTVMYELQDIRKIKIWTMSIDTSSLFLSRYIGMHRHAIWIEHHSISRLTTNRDFNQILIQAINLIHIVP